MADVAVLVLAGIAVVAIAVLVGAITQKPTWTLMSLIWGGFGAALLLRWRIAERTRRALRTEGYRELSRPKKRPAGPLPPAAHSPSSLLVNYRRGPAAGYAGRLIDALVHRYGASQVLDSQRGKAGVWITEHARQLVSQSGVVIVVVDPYWQSTAGPAELKTRSADEMFEAVIREALQQARTIIPTLVLGARMPRTGSLPSDLDPLARVHAIELSDDDWAHDLQRLVGTLDSRFTAAT